jgi:flagellar hook-associated protein 3 FlgL
MSSIRVNPFPMPDLLAALEQLQQQTATTTLELATGSSINKPSDNPSVAAEVIRLNASSSQSDSFQSTIGSINGQFSTADSTLSSVVTSLQSALSLGVEAAGGTLSSTDLADIATELTSIQSQVLSLANTSYQGQYIFAGTDTAQPFVLDPAQPSGVSYNGNTDTNKVTIGAGYQLQINVPGSQVFGLGSTGGDVFQSIHDLITAVQNNTGIGTAVNEVDAALGNVTTQRTFYDDAMNQAQSQQTYLNSQSLSLSQQLNTVTAANVATLASQLESEQTAQTATLEAIGNTPQKSLFDYLS